jgi:hypothetical protein
MNFHQTSSEAVQQFSLLHDTTERSNLLTDLKERVINFVFQLADMEGIESKETMRFVVGNMVLQGAKETDPNTTLMSLFNLVL